MRLANGHAPPAYLWVRLELLAQRGVLCVARLGCRSHHTSSLTLKLRLKPRMALSNVDSKHLPIRMNDVAIVNEFKVLLASLFPPFPFILSAQSPEFSQTLKLLSGFSRAKYSCRPGGSNCAVYRKDKRSFCSKGRVLMNLCDVNRASRRSQPGKFRAIHRRDAPFGCLERVRAKGYCRLRSS